MSLGKIIDSKRNLTCAIDMNNGDDKTIYKQIKKLNEGLDTFFDNYSLSLKSNQERMYAEVNSSGEIILYPLTDNALISIFNIPQENKENGGFIEKNTHFSNIKIGNLKIRVYHDYSSYSLDNKR